MKFFLRIIVLLQIFFSLALSGNSIRQDGKPFNVVSSSSDGVILEFVPQRYDRITQLVNGREYVSFHRKGAGFTSEAGKPQLPEEGTLVGIPPNVTVSIEILESKFSYELSGDVIPAPMYTFDENNEAIADYQQDVRFYETEHSFYPQQFVEVAGISQLREQRVARIIIHPLQYNPGSKQIKKLEHLRIRCNFINNTKLESAVWQTVSSDPHFEPLYKNLIANYSDSKRWLGKPIASAKLNTADSAAWFTPGHPYFRIPIGSDGMYRLTFLQLFNTGIDLRRVDINGLALYTKGESVPLQINTSSFNPKKWFIDFYAKRNYGVNSYFDLYSDTSHYWLSVDDSNPLRFQETASIAGVPIAQPLYYTETVHFEQDRKYYFGYNSDEISDPNDVPGEEWYWADFFPNNILLDTFVVDSVQRVAGGTVTMRARLHGMTKTSTPSQHLAEFRVNNIPVGQISWVDNTEALFTGSFPDSILKSGSNYFRVRSAPTASPVNKIYVDWVELDYNRPLQAKGNQVEFTALPQSGNGLTKFTVPGFTNDSVNIYDLTNYRNLIPASSGGGTIVFQDTCNAPKRYLILPKDSQKTVSAVEPKIFTNLRNHAIGADYIVITHRDFKDAAVRLAQARSVHGNLRSLVVDVQDIYDEFNYGLLKPEALKNFLQYAYEHWPQPAPTYVVMFGDACWDFKGRIATTIKKNYVPAFGNPPSDNALVSFDETLNYLPYMLIGRLPVENSLQADKLVTKILNYDHAPLDEWNKKSMFVTGGTDSSEQAFFNTYSESLIEYNIAPPPVQGHVERIYKTSSIIIDGDSKSRMQGIVNKGISYLNFIGHSGGRLWNVDIGNPIDLQNTSGKLPFIASVSCNVGFFSAPNFNVLSEDFLLADNRGAIAVWSGSSIGYALVGWWLAEKFLDAAVFNDGRSLGQLTTLSRINFWSINAITSPLVIQTLQLHPLLGDPYTMFALPLKPDIDVAMTDIRCSTDQPTSDSVVTLNVSYRNYGLVLRDSILVSLKDQYTTLQGKYAGESDIVPPFYVAPFSTVDSLFVRWNVQGKPGSHVVKVSFDPGGQIPEVRKTNNSADAMIYVYKNILTPLKPAAFSVVHSGSQQLVVSLPSTMDTTALQYYFEIDTIADFSSSARTESGPLSPGPVSAQWQTAPLSDHQTYFWRARTFDGSKYGAWTFSVFTVNDALAATDSIVWLQSGTKQFVYDTVSNIAFTDSGVTMKSSSGLPLFIRSVGARVYPDSDYYSQIQIGEIKINGLYFYGANSFIAARINPVNGDYQAKGYDLRNVGQTDSLISFLQSTPDGFYVALSAVSNARTNVTEPLYQLIESLGSTQIRNVLTGQSWCLLSRKGAASPTPLENYSPAGIATIQFQMPNYYGFGTGLVSSPLIGPASQWLSLSWDNITVQPLTNIFITVYGVRQDSTIDSIYSVQSDSQSVDLTWMNASIYNRIYLSARLNNNDGTSTPQLIDWKVIYLPLPDLASNVRSLYYHPASIQPGDSLTVDMTIYNIGLRNADSVMVSMRDSAVPSWFIASTGHSIPAGEYRTVRMSFMPPPSVLVNRKLTADITMLNSADAFSGNNAVAFSVNIGTAEQSSTESIQILFDGRTIADGDFVSPTPLITIAVPVDQDKRAKASAIGAVLLDGAELYTTVNKSVTGSDASVIQENGTYRFQPSLSDGEHTLTVIGVSEYNNPVLAKSHFTVLSKPGIMNVFNFPNPFQSETNFTFVLTGAAPPEKLTLKIYSVAGRLIWQADLSRNDLQIGLNTVRWDGRDREGDIIANGYYFVKYKIESTSGQEESIQKIVKLQ